VEPWLVGRSHPRIHRPICSINRAINQAELAVRLRSAQGTISAFSGSLSCQLRCRGQQFEPVRERSGVCHHCVAPTFLGSLAEKGKILFGHFDVHLNGSFHDLLNQAFLLDLHVTHRTLSTLCTSLSKRRFHKEQLRCSGREGRLSQRFRTKWAGPDQSQNFRTAIRTVYSRGFARASLSVSSRSGSMKSEKTPASLRSKVCPVCLRKLTDRNPRA
jgi:hypothetical protein